MRINKFVAQATGISRRAADTALEQGRIQVNGTPATVGQDVSSSDTVTLDGQTITPEAITTILLNKPVGYVCSRDGQGSDTIYDLLPPELHHLKAVGRLDKDSSGLLVLTNDGGLANQLSHPSFRKEKTYQVTLSKPLGDGDRQAIETGVELEDGSSKLALQGEDKQWNVTMSEGRNRQIRRTFEKLGYRVVKLHRTSFGPYTLGALSPGKYKNI